MTTATQQKTKTLIHWIDALKRHRSKPAVVTFSDDDIRRYTYAELSHDVLRLANGLAERGVQRDDLVGLVAESSPASIAACLAIVKAGAIPVPIDAQFETATLEHVLNDSEPSIVFTAGKHRERLEKIESARSPDLIRLDEPDHPQHWRQLLTEDRNDFPEPEPDDTAVLFYTSGTTDPPKAVPLSHRNVGFQVEAVMDANVVSEEDRVLLPLPLHHVYPYVIGMLTPLAMGLQIVLPPSLTGPQIVRALREGDVTVVIGVPRLYRALVGGVEAKAEAAGWMAKVAFGTMLGLSTRLRRTTGVRVGKRLLGSLHKQFGPNLRVLASGGSPLDDELAWKLEGMGWQVAIGYGLTETSPLLTINPPGGIKIGSVGRAVPGIELRLDPSAMPDEADDAESVQEQRVGQGELLAKGPGVFSGYRGLPEKTEEVFTEDGWFRTGDLGSIDDEGWVYVTGRASTLIVTEAGENVQPDEVEAAYSESPAIREVGVLQDQGRLVGLIVPDMSELRDAAGSAEDVEKAVRQAVEERSKRLPSYQRLADLAITRETIPRTRLGKIQRHKLRERYQQAKQGGEGRQSAGPLPIEEMSTEDRLAFGAAVVRQEKNLVWFPEGERSRDGQLKPFKPGLGLILSRYPATVVPAFIHGSYKALPRDRSLPRLTKITVTFGRAVPADDLRQLGDGDEPHKRIVDVLHERVAALHDSG